MVRGSSPLVGSTLDQAIRHPVAARPIAPSMDLSMSSLFRGWETQYRWAGTRGGSHQVLVYSSVDPVAGKDSYLTESTTGEKKILDQVTSARSGRSSAERGCEGGPVLHPRGLDGSSRG